MHATSKRGAVTENTISLFTDWILLFHQWHVMSFIYWFFLCLCIERDDFTSNAGTMWIARDVNIFFSIHAIRRSAIMWWIAVWVDGFDELKSNVKFIQYFHCGYILKYSLKPAWKSILANWNYENSPYVLCNLNLVADFGWNSAMYS